MTKRSEALLEQILEKLNDILENQQSLIEVVKEKEKEKCDLNKIITTISDNQKTFMSLIKTNLDRNPNDKLSRDHKISKENTNSFNEKTEWYKVLNSRKIAYYKKNKM